MLPKDCRTWKRRDVRSYLEATKANFLPMLITARTATKQEEYFECVARSRSHSIQSTTLDKLTHGLALLGARTTSAPPPEPPHHVIPLSLITESRKAPNVSNVRMRTLIGLNVQTLSNFAILGLQRRSIGNLSGGRSSSGKRHRSLKLKLIREASKVCRAMGGKMFKELILERETAGAKKKKRQKMTPN